MTDRELVDYIKAALETDEDGENLVTVARAACRAEQEFAALERKRLYEAR